MSSLQRLKKPDISQVAVHLKKTHGGLFAMSLSNDDAIFYAAKLAVVGAEAWCSEVYRLTGVCVFKPADLEKVAAAVVAAGFQLGVAWSFWREEMGQKL